MFSLRTKKSEKSVSYPLIVKDGAVYVEFGQTYDESLYETDSDFDDDEQDDCSPDLETDSLHETVHETIESTADNDNTPPVENTTVCTDHSINIQCSVVVNETKSQMTDELETGDTLVDNHVPCTPSAEKSSDSSDSEETMTLDEKRALLALAAKLDRVDIIQSILKPTGADVGNPAQWAAFLLNNRLFPPPSSSSSHGEFVQANLEPIFLPPLHLAIAFSSVNAANCMLRLGADPSIRPTIPQDWSGPIGLEDYDDSNFTWSMFNGLSAWDVVLYEDDETTSIHSGSPKSSWFKWSSSSDTTSSETSREASRIFNISPSKREGLKHAFLSEALRAIGSDDVARFRDILDCGIHDNPQSRTLFGGKDLMEWCIEMNAVGCIQLLKESLSGADTEIQVMHSVLTGAESKASSVSQPSALNHLAENEALFNALSSILDNLADEISITRDLVLDNSSNDAFLSQVRTLKLLREQKESDIVTWTEYLSNSSDELENAIFEWKDLGGDDDILLQISQADEQQFGLENKHPNRVTDASLDPLSSELALSESRVQKLRDTINELAAENSDNLIKIEQKGLIGAVQLARSLREDLRLKQEELSGLKAQDEYCRSKLNFLKSKIKVLLHEKENSDPVPLLGSDETSKQENSSQPQRVLIHHVDSLVPTPETAEDAFAENGIDNESDDVKILEESNYENLKETQAIMLRQHQYLPIRIWDLILRIMGLGREAVRQSLYSTEGDNISRIMIV